MALNNKGLAFLLLILGLPLMVLPVSAETIKEQALRKKAEAEARARAGAGEASVPVKQTSTVKRVPPQSPARKRASTEPQVDESLRAGHVFKDCSDCPSMVVVPEGRFTMGSPAYEGDRSKDEGPEHEVVFSRPFAVGRYHVTRGQFAAFVNDTGYSPASDCYRWVDNKDKTVEKDASWRSPGFEQANDHPAVCVNWDDAKAYVSWLARKTGQPYRLLSEAEYEYAARAGSVSRYSWGSDAVSACSFANVADRGSGIQTLAWWRSAWAVHDCNDGYRYTSPVGSFRPNAFGLYDMTGNAWNWLEDCWHEDYNGAPTDGGAWVTGTCEKRVLRGGSWSNIPQNARAAYRLNNAPARRNDGYGLRVARML